VTTDDESKRRLRRVDASPSSAPRVVRTTSNNNNNNIYIQEERATASGGAVYSSKASSSLTVRFRAQGHPVTQGSKRAYVVNGRPVMVESARGHKLWRHAVNDEARRAYGDRPPLTGPVMVTLAFDIQPPKSKPKRTRTWPVGARSGDLDKLARCCLDSLTGVAYLDDAQVVMAIVAKDWAGPAGPGVTITVRPVGPA
jgi:Holliday junction resolvase RusA-like endonuclease